MPFKILRQVAKKMRNVRAGLIDEWDKEARKVNFAVDDYDEILSLPSDSGEEGADYYDEKFSLPGTEDLVVGKVNPALVGDDYFGGGGFTGLGGGSGVGQGYSRSDEKLAKAAARAREKAQKKLEKLERKKKREEERTVL